MADTKLMEQIQQLKAMTVRVGSIHEAQALQIRNYPQLLTDVKAVQTKIDVETKRVIYEVEVKKGFRWSKRNKDMLTNIVAWVRTWIWDETEVEIHNGKKVIFNSKDLKNE